MQCSPNHTGHQTRPRVQRCQNPDVIEFPSAGSHMSGGIQNVKLNFRMIPYTAGGISRCRPIEADVRLLGHCVRHVWTCHACAWLVRDPQGHGRPPYTAICVKLNFRMIPYTARGYIPLQADRGRRQAAGALCGTRVDLPRMGLARQGPPRPWPATLHSNLRQVDFSHDSLHCGGYIPLQADRGRRQAAGAPS